jgi:hypothetical protein
MAKKPFDPESEGEYDEVRAIKSVTSHRQSISARRGMVWWYWRICQG